MIDKKALKKQYAQTVQPMGVFQVRNLANGKLFIGSGLNLQGKINSTRFQLGFGSFPNRELQKDYTALGESGFAFEVVDRLEPKDEAGYDYREDLASLEEMWIEKLQPFGEKGYNRPKAKG
jgi:hypothetical protein